LRWSLPSGCASRGPVGQPARYVRTDQLTTTVGARFLDRKLTVAVRWQAVAAKPLSEIPISNRQPVFPPTAARNLVNLYAGYAFNSDVMACFSIENPPVSFQLQ
jgi:hemoglobin/transferrin/lactoferrin receptor protein